MGLLDLIFGERVPPAFSKNPFPPEDCDHFVSQVA